MKNRTFGLLAVTLFFLVGCGDAKQNAPVKNDAEKVKSEVPVSDGEKDVGPSGQLKLTTENTTVKFVGAKLVGSHEGVFNEFSGTVDFKDGDPLTAAVRVKIDMSSVETDSPQLDTHLKSPDFFDIEKFSHTTFVSTDVTKSGKVGDNHFVVTGELTLHGITKEVAIPATITVSDEKIVMASQFTINRKDYGIVYPGMPDNLIKDNVEIMLSIDATL